jgi:hypothetical protein
MHNKIVSAIIALGAFAVICLVIIGASTITGISFDNIAFCLFGGYVLERIYKRIVNDIHE